MAGESAIDRGMVLKLYLTEADARADTNALQVTDDTAFIVNEDQAANYNFFTHERYFARIEANDPVLEFYIDWDDGEDNDPSGNANYTLIKFDTPQFVGISSHIFTRDKLHFPKIRVKSSDGYLSKFYQANGDNVFNGIDVLQGESTLPTGRNETYKIESDNTGANEERIPIFAPTPKPPVAVLKADKKRVFAGITNKYLSGTGGTFDGKTCRLIGSHSTMDTARGEVKVRVTYQKKASDEGDKFNTGAGELIVEDMTMAGNATIADVLKVVKMELINLLEDTVDMTDSGNATSSKLFPGEKLLLVTNLDGSNELEDESSTQPSIIGEVSLGNPILELDDPKHTVTLDATESFARCPETTVDEYKIWDGDFLFNNGYDTNSSFMARSATNISDIFSDGAGTATLLATDGMKHVSYAFHPLMTFTDEYHRWLPMQKLAMAQVKQSAAVIFDATAPATESDSLATYQYSFLEHWADESVSDNYKEDRAGIAGYNWPTDMQSSAFIAFKGDQASGWHDLDQANRSTGTIVATNASPDVHHAIFSQRDGAGISSDVEYLFGQTSQSLDEAGRLGAYMMCCSDKKWSKQWFQSIAFSSLTTGGQLRAAPVILNTAANASTGLAGRNVTNEWSGISFAGVRTEIFYTASVDGTDTNVEWRPLKYKNNTKHPYLNDSTWYSSGSIEWIEPTDWVACDPASIPDRFWPSGDFEGDTDGTNFSSTAGSSSTENYFDASNRWNATNKKFGLMWVVAGDGGVSAGHSRYGWGPMVMSTFRCSNQHSVLIDIVDPMHVSLNTHAFTQSVSYTHKGKYQIVEDRMGKSEIRKIGAVGGKITFGGVDLKDQDGTNTRDKFYEYQKRAVPVYFDITHESGNISRFFGVITDMSEDHPVGKQYGKFGLSMQCSHMITMNSSGVITSDGYISLGGDMVDEHKFI